MNYLKYKYNTLFFLFVCIGLFSVAGAQENFSFSGAETSNFDTLSLNLSAAWTTERGAAPGYFSAVGNAIYTGGSDAFHINGYVKKYGNQSFDFPVGSGSDLRTLSITAPGLNTDVYAAAWVAGDPGAKIDATGPNPGVHPVTAVQAPIQSVSDIGQWDWQVGDAGNLGAGSTGTGAGLTVTASIPDMSVFAQPTSLRLVGWDGNQWVDLSGGATATGNLENSTLTGTMVAGITAIGIGSIDFPTAVEQISFEATGENCSVDLQWRIVNGGELSSFIIEQSLDGSNFKIVDEVPASGTNQDSIYHYQIPQKESLAYYRLRLMHKDGTYTYSKVVAGRTSCLVVEEVVLYPNPVSEGETITLSITTNYKGTLRLIMTNIPGQKLMQQQERVYGGRMILPINVSRFAQGVYFLNVFTNEGIPLRTGLKFTIAN